jgi:hypothetical protein
VVGHGPGAPPPELGVARSREFDVFGLLIRHNRSKASWALAAFV